MAFLIPLIFLELCAMGSSFSVSCSSSQLVPVISSSRPAAFPPTEIVMRNHILLKGKLKRNSRERLEENGKAKNTGCLLTGMVATAHKASLLLFLSITRLTVACGSPSPLWLIVTCVSSSAAHHRHPQLTVVTLCLWLIIHNSSSLSAAHHLPRQLTVMWNHSSTFISPIPASACPTLTIVNDHSCSLNQRHPHRLVFRMLSSMLACSLEDCIRSLKVLPTRSED